MLVSIITPIYKSQKYIEDCARSLFEQSYKEIEYIFVDDVCGDKSIDILEKVISDYPLRSGQINIIHHERNTGSAMARETGMQAAHGDYVIHVDSDDTVDKYFIEHLVDAVIENDADAAICNIVAGNTKNPKFSISQELCDDPYNLVANVLADTTHASLCNKLFKLSLFLENDIHFSKDLNIYDDKSVVFRVLYYCKKIVAVKEDLYFYNKNNNNSITHKIRNNPQLIKAMVVFARLVDSFFSDKHLSENVKDNIQKSIILWKNTLAGMLLNHVPIKKIRNEIREFEPFRPNVFLFQSSLPTHYKLVLLFYIFKLYPLICLQRNLVVMLYDMYYNTDI